MAAVSGVSSELADFSRLVDPSEPAKAPSLPDRTRPTSNAQWLRDVGWPAGHLGRNLSATLHAGLSRLPQAFPCITVQLPSDAVGAANALKVAQRYLSGTSVPQAVRVEGTVSAAFLSALKPLCPNLRLLDLSDCAFAGSAVECVHLLAHFNQLHELNLDLKTLSRDEAEAVLEALGTDASSPLVTLRLFGCDRLDLAQREAHKRLFALPQLRVLHFYHVASDKVLVGTRWAVERRFQPEPFQTNGALLLVHRERPALPPIVPHSRDQIILPV